MANQSQVIFQDKKSVHASRLIRSLQSLDKVADPNTLPAGVWGSTATIRSGGITINSSDLDFDFSIPFDDKLEAVEGDITIYNLSDSTIKQFKSDAELTIEAGYEGDTGLVFSGNIKKVSTKRENADKVTTIKVACGTNSNETVNMSFGKGTKASYILSKLIQKTGLAVGRFEIKSDYIYKNGETINTSLQSAISTYAEVCGVQTIIVNGVINCCDTSAFNQVQFVISESTGMIGSPSPFEDQEEKGYDVEMLLQHRMTAGALVELQSEQYSGKFHVKSGTHTFNSGECKTEIKIVA